MKTIRVSEATNIQLDYLVAKCAGRTPSLHEYSKGGDDWFILMQTGVLRTGCAFSTEWAQMGPIIDSEDIDVIRVADISDGVKEYRGRIEGGNPTSGYGPTRLIAAARCYVVSKLGEIVEVPEELT